MTRPPFPSVIDSSLMSAARACGRKAELEYFHHYKSKTENVHLHAGKAFARGLEVAREAFFVNGEDEQTAVAMGVGALLEAYGNFECPPDSAKSAVRMAGALEYYFSSYEMATDPAPPATLPSGDRAIEFSFLEPLDIKHPETGDPILYAGRFDMICDYAGGLFGEDDKTTSSLGASWAKQWDLRAQFTAYCLTPDTEVLGEYGWIPISELQPGEAIVQWSKDGNLSYVVPSAIHSPDYSGPMLACEGKVQFVATPDHRQVVWDTHSQRYKDYTSATLPQRSGGLRFISGGKLQGGVVNLPKAFIQLLVAIQADGSWKDGGVRFHFTKDRKARRLESLLEQLDIPCNWHDTEDWSVQLNHLWVRRAFSILTEEKIFGAWILQLSQENLEDFVQEVGHWDGTLPDSSSGWMYFSTVESNCEWVRTVACLTGRYSSSHSQEGWKGGKPQHRVCISDSCHHSPHLHNFRPVQYDGKVYCVTVPSSYFLIRVGGRTMVTGNCWGARQGGMPLQGFLVRGISILKTKYETAQAVTYRPDWQIDRWYEQTLKDIRRLIEQWDQGKFDYNLDHSCAEFGGCMFRQVCMSKDPAPWLSIGFERRRWDPVSREETVL